jgi:hypothetical protein
MLAAFFTFTFTSIIACTITDFHSNRYKEAGKLKTELIAKEDGIKNSELNIKLANIVRIGIVKKWIMKSKNGKIFN